MATQIPLDESAREALRLYKVISGSTNYSDAIRSLMTEAGYEPPEEPLSDEEMLARVFGPGKK